MRVCDDCGNPMKEIALFTSVAYECACDGLLPTKYTVDNCPWWPPFESTDYYDHYIIECGEEGWKFSEYDKVGPNGWYYHKTTRDLSTGKVFAKFYANKSWSPPFTINPDGSISPAVSIKL